MEKQHFRGVIWPRNDANPSGANGGIHRYVIVGMLVTSEPLQFEGENEVVLDGQTFGMADVLEQITRKEAAIKLGDASNVLLNLQYMVRPEPPPKSKKRQKKKVEL